MIINMKIDLRKFELNKNYLINEDVDFSTHEFTKGNRIKRIDSCHLEISLTCYEDLARLVISGSGQVTGICSYTLEDVPYAYKFKEEISFSKEEETETCYFEPEDVIDLDPYLFAFIDASVPLSLKKKGAKLPEAGDGYRVLTEDQLNEERKKSQDPRWSKLDDIDL